MASRSITQNWYSSTSEPKRRNRCHQRADQCNNTVFPIESLTLIHTLSVPLSMRIRSPHQYTHRGEKSFSSISLPSSSHHTNHGCYFILPFAVTQLRAFAFIRVVCYLIFMLNRNFVASHSHMIHCDFFPCSQYSKRGVSSSSEIYLRTKSYMLRGTTKTIQSDITKWNVLVHCANQLQCRSSVQAFCRTAFEVINADTARHTLVCLIIFLPAPFGTIHVHVYLVMHIPFRQTENG